MKARLHRIGSRVVGVESSGVRSRRFRYKHLTFEFAESAYRRDPVGGRCAHGGGDVRSRPRCGCRGEAGGDGEAAQCAGQGGLGSGGQLCPWRKIGQASRRRQRARLCAVGRDSIGELRERTSQGLPGRRELLRAARERASGQRECKNDGAGEPARNLHWRRGRQPHHLRQ